MVVFVANDSSPEFQQIADSISEIRMKNIDIVQLLFYTFNSGDDRQSEAEYSSIKDSVNFSQFFEEISMDLY